MGNESTNLPAPVDAELVPDEGPENMDRDTTDLAWAGDTDDTDEVALSGSARDRIRRGVADNTRRSYGAQWQAFARWCAAVDVDALPCPQGAFDNYVAALMDAGKAPKSIELAISAVRAAHKASGHEPPTTDHTTRMLVSYGRDRADAGHGTQKARVLKPAEIRTVCTECPDTPAGIRDRAFVLLAFRTGRRFSELAALRLDEIQLDDKGLLYRVRRTKTDQTGARSRWQRLFPNPQEVVCPVAAVTAWVTLLAARGITDGVLFRRVDRHGHIAGEPTAAGASSTSGQLSNQGANDLWRRALLRAGLDPKGVSTHTARRSAMTAGYRAGRSLVELTDRLGYVRGSKVALGYIEAADAEDTDPLAGLL